MYINIFDYLLLPFYLLLFYLIIRKKSRQYEEEGLNKIFITAFWLRVLGSLAFSFVFQYYYGYADSFMYYRGGSFISTEVLANFGNLKLFFVAPNIVQEHFQMKVGDESMYGYILIPANLAIMRVSAFFSFIAFNKFLIISLFMATFSFAGQWKLFLVFNDIAKKKNQKLLAYLILYSPSLFFWGSGLLKEPICFGCMGFILYILYFNLLKGNFKFIHLIYISLFSILLFTIKDYILLILTVSFLFSILCYLIIKLKTRVFKILLLFIFLAITIIFSRIFTDSVNKIIEDSFLQITNFKANYERIQEIYETGVIDVKEFEEKSLGYLISRSPNAIITALYRPFLWDSSKIIMIFSALETSLALFFTFYLLFKTKIYGFFILIFKNPYLIFCFLASLLFALLIGFTTFNFGTLVRYRIVMLPFFYFLLYSIYIQVKERSDENRKQVISPGTTI